jgi:CheY-like chemotaxis protein
VAKILVADDNSNIQKMVGLALKDQGIDVVAVGNGEAAVRKISDVRPDLVLADVFMPVRNGYEVCNYVKQDSALSHIPVILLVGAFDPLDEQEAQRVGADGVLKKPFVPPDPLISMVKSALTRAGVIIGAAETAPPPPPPPVATARVEPPPLPKIAPPPPPPAPEKELDLGVPVFSSRPAPVNIDKADQPLAFGTLLDSPAEEETVFTTSSGSQLAPERDWGHSAEQEEQEAEGEGSKNGAWRSSSIDELSNEAPAGQTDWREAAFAGIGTEKPHQEWAPSVEKNGLSITEEEAAEVAKAQSAETPVRGPEDWSKVINAIFDKPEAVREPTFTSAPAEIAAAPVVEQAPAAQVSEPASTAPAPELKAETPAPEPSPALNSWMAGALSPWEAELQRANELSSTWDSAKITPAAVVEETSATEAFLNSGLMATAHEHVVEAIEEAKAEQVSYSAPVEEAPAHTESLYSPEEHEELHEAEELSATVVSEPEPVRVEAPLGAAVSTGVPSEPNMDELVAKVLAKMNPEMLQAVTREILKPVVEALVKDELSKK